jgi:hypothetical protein
MVGISPFGTRKASRVNSKHEGKKVRYFYGWYYSMFYPKDFGGSGIMGFSMVMPGKH